MGRFLIVMLARSALAPTAGAKEARSVSPDVGDAEEHVVPEPVRKQSAIRNVAAGPGVPVEGRYSFRDVSCERVPRGALRTPGPGSITSESPVAVRTGP